MEDEFPIQDDIAEFEYNGKTLYLSEDDRRVWNNLSREDKRLIYVQQEKKLRSGLFFEVTDASGKTGIMRRVDAMNAGFVVRVGYEGKYIYLKRAEALKRGFICTTQEK